MFRIIHEVLTAPELADVLGELKTGRFNDGAASARGSAKLVKHNEQLDPEHHKALISTITQKIRGHSHFRGFAMPLDTHPVLINRFSTGMEYGNHIDVAAVGGMRTDLSFTLFLSDPASYEGGELVIETEVGEQSFKLPAGALLLYPANRMHRVNRVTRGQRLAAVSWAKSAIADNEKRDLCVDLDMALHRLYSKHGASTETDQISKVINKLRHLWGRESG